MTQDHNTIIAQAIELGCAAPEAHALYDRFVAQAAGRCASYVEGSHTCLDSGELCTITARLELCSSYPVLKEAHDEP